MLSEDWNTPYVLKFYKPRHGGDVQHRNSIWLILRKHSEIDSSSPPPGHTPEHSLSGLQRSHLELVRLSVSASLPRQAARARLGETPTHLTHLIVHWPGCFLLPWLCEKLSADNPWHAFAYLPSENTSSEGANSMLALFYALGILWNYLILFQIHVSL